MAGFGFDGVAEAVEVGSGVAAVAGGRLPVEVVLGGGDGAGGGGGLGDAGVGVVVGDGGGCGVVVGVVCGDGGAAAGGVAEVAGDIELVVGEDAEAGGAGDVATEREGGGVGGGTAYEDSISFGSVTVEGNGASAREGPMFVYPAARFGLPKYTGMKATAWDGKAGRSNGSWIEAMKAVNEQSRFVLCIRNNGAEDLEPRKVYQVLDGGADDQEGLIRIIEESGEDYLYPAEYFVAVKLPPAAVRELSSPAATPKPRR